MNLKIFGNDGINICPNFCRFFISDPSLRGVTTKKVKICKNKLGLSCASYLEKMIHQKIVMHLADAAYMKGL